LFVPDRQLVQLPPAEVSLLQCRIEQGFPPGQQRGKRVAALLAVVQA
jgi:hypothetical protein